MNRSIRLMLRVATLSCMLVALFTLNEPLEASSCNDAYQACYQDCMAIYTQCVNEEGIACSSALNQCQSFCNAAFNECAVPGPACSYDWVCFDLDWYPYGMCFQIAFGCS
jgi:hypothetical protein